MACHKRTEHPGVGCLGTISKYSGERNCAAVACGFLKCSSETFSSLRQSLITNLVSGNFNCATIWKSRGRLKKSCPEQSIGCGRIHWQVPIFHPKEFVHCNLTGIFASAPAHATATLYR